jgi:hypothetical protein
MAYPTISKLEQYPILQSIERLRRQYKNDKKLHTALILLLEALANESSRLYGGWNVGGYEYMERALEDAQKYIKQSGR